MLQGRPKENQKSVVAYEENNDHNTQGSCNQQLEILDDKAVDQEAGEKEDQAKFKHETDDGDNLSVVVEHGKKDMDDKKKGANQKEDEREGEMDDELDDHDNHAEHLNCLELTNWSQIKE